MQEEILSRRLLRFAKGQVWWQCNEGQCNERDPYGRNAIDERSSTNWKYNSPRLTLRREDEKFMAPWFSPLEIWYRAVNDFSSRRITYPKDRFPAISGISKEVHRHISQDYKAGLWLGDMNMGLLWSSPGPGAVKVGDHAASYVAPSWSWASVNFSTAERPGLLDHCEIYEERLFKYPFMLAYRYSHWRRCRHRRWRSIRPSYRGTFENPWATSQSLFLPGFASIL